MNKTRQWALLTAVACLAILAAGWFLVVKPQRAHATDLRSQQASVEANNNKLRAQISQLQQQAKDLPAQQKLLSQIATKVPDNPALPSLIRQLSTAADGAGVNLIGLSPSTPSTSLPGAPAGPTSAATAAAPGGVLAVIPVQIQVQGTYFNLEQFFSSLESLSRAVLVTGFTVTPATTAGAGSSAGSPGSGAGGSSLPPGTLTAQVNANVFETAQAATPTTTAKTTATTVTGK